MSDAFAASRITHVRLQRDLYIYEDLARLYQS
jgi:hypothetical protein